MARLAHAEGSALCAGPCRRLRAEPHPQPAVPEGRDGDLPHRARRRPSRHERRSQPQRGDPCRPCGLRTPGSGRRRRSWRRAGRRALNLRDRPKAADPSTLRAARPLRAACSRAGRRAGAGVWSWSPRGWRFARYRSARPQRVERLKSWRFGSGCDRQSSSSAWGRSDATASVSAVFGATGPACFARRLAQAGAHRSAGRPSQRQSTSACAASRAEGTRAQPWPQREPA